MEITKENRGDVVVIAIRGKLVGSVDNSQRFHDLVRETLNAGTKRIVVDLRETPWAESQGIGMLIGAFTSAKNTGARLVLAEVGSRIRDVLAVTRLTLIFDVFDTVDLALENLSARRAASAGIASLRTM